MKKTNRILDQFIHMAVAICLGSKHGDRELQQKSKETQQGFSFIKKAACSGCGGSASLPLPAVLEPLGGPAVAAVRIVKGCPGLAGLAGASCTTAARTCRRILWGSTGGKDRHLTTKGESELEWGWPLPQSVVACQARVTAAADTGNDGAI